MTIAHSSTPEVFTNIIDIQNVSSDDHDSNKGNCLIDPVSIVPVPITLAEESHVSTSNPAPTEREKECSYAQSSAASSLSVMSKTLNNTGASSSGSEEGLPTDEQTRATGCDSVCSKTLDKSALQPTTKTTSTTPSDKSRSNNNANKNPLEALNDYVSFFFRKPEVYEEKIEIRESKADLKASLDAVRHGGVTLRYNGSRIELAAEDSDILDHAVSECAEPPTSPRLSPTTEAVAAVEAISHFRSLSEVRNEIKESRSHSFGPEDDALSVKRQKSAQREQNETDGVVDDDEMKEKWEVFCNGRKQNAFDEVAIQV